MQGSHELSKPQTAATPFLLHPNTRQVPRKVEERLTCYKGLLASSEPQEDSPRSKQTMGGCRIKDELFICFMKPANREHTVVIESVQR